MRGRKPTPTVLKQLHGNPGKRALPKAEPVALGVLSAAPDHLTDDQQAGWRYAMQHAPRGVLKKIDRALLTAWVVAESFHRDATIRQAAVGSLLYTPKGSTVPIPSPFISIINKQTLLMVKLASELGFSPASRPRLGDGRRGDDADDIPAPRGKHGEGRVPLATFIARNPDAKPLH